MASGGEIRALDERGRIFPSLHAFTHWPALERRHVELGITPPATEDVADVPPLLAHVSDDMWCVDCPDCGGGEMVWTNDLKIWCHRCGNAAVGGLYRPVELPEAASAIEDVLSKRPRRETRNWRHNETLDELRAQNQEAGDPV